MALAENRKAYFDYEVMESLEAGIELLGWEVKSIRGGRASLDGAYVTIRGREAYIMQMSVPPYQPTNAPESYGPLRQRRLLLTRAEIQRLADIESKKGLTIVPLKVYNKGAKLKVEIAIVRGKKRFDKRQSIKKRETDREIRRTLKNE
jgi:SsrA-binding protein